MRVSFWRRCAASTGAYSSTPSLGAPFSSTKLRNSSPHETTKEGSVGGENTEDFSLENGPLGETTEWNSSTSGDANREGVGSLSSDLLGYPIRRAAAFELLYGGVRICHLVQPVFPLKRIKSEHLPSPSLQAEREDLGLEMQLPSHKDPTQLPSYRIHGQVASHTQVDDAGGGKDGFHDGFDMGKYFNDLHQPALHHNSSPPYNPATNTNNVLALRLFPVNIGIRDRTEAIRLRTQDCWERVQHWKLTARLGLPTQYPLPIHTQKQLRSSAFRIDTAGKPRSLYSGALDPRRGHTRSTLPVTINGLTVSSQVCLPSASILPDMMGACCSISSSNHNNNNNNMVRSSEKDGVERSRRTVSVHYLPHMKRDKLYFHPPPSSLSIFTVPSEGKCSRWIVTEHQGKKVKTLVHAADLLPSSSSAATAAVVGSRHGQPKRSPWMPFQMLKPMGYNWSPTRRSSGNRGPSAQLVQERLDQKGFGWKRKSRYLWQQDIDTAGFRPHRFY